MKLSYLARKILKAHKTEGFESIMICGEMGRGKTSLALHLAYQVYQDWDLVLHYLHFSPISALKQLRYAISNDSRLKLIILDDAGLWLDALSWFTPEIRAFSKFYNIIREGAAAVIFTNVLPGDILKRVRKKVWYKVYVDYYDIENKKSIGIVYREKYDVGMDKFYRRKITQIIYPTFYPDEVYIKYKQMRKKAALEALDETIELFENRINITNIVLKLREKGLSLREIAKVVNKSHTTVRNILLKYGK